MVTLQLETECFDEDGALDLDVTQSDQPEAHKPGVVHPMTGHSEAHSGHPDTAGHEAGRSDNSKGTET